MFKLRDWHFGPDELATIRWIKSPFNDDRNGWILPVVFEGSKGHIVQTNTSWGSLVLMRFGQTYKAGVPFEACKDGSIVMLDVKDASKGRLTEASAVKDFLPGAIVVPDSENCWQFENDGATVFIPCIEIVRAFLAPNITMANALLTPYGLNDIVTSTINGKQLSLRFDSTVPRRMIDNSFVHYLAWLTSDERALEAWSSVYRWLMPKGAVEEIGQMQLCLDDSGVVFPGDKRLQVGFPVQGPCWLQARVLQNENRIFVLEIVGVTGLSLAIETVSYSHASFSHKRKIELHARPKSVRRARKKEKREIELVNDNPSSSSETRMVDITPTIIGFSNQITLRQILQESTRIRRTTGNSSHKQLSKRERKEAEIRAYQERLAKQNQEHMEEEFQCTGEVNFSVGEVFFDGNPKTKHIEVDGLRVINSPFGCGLNTFFKMLSVLERLDDGLKIGQPKIMVLSGSRGFAVKREDGAPRRCVWVPVELKAPERGFVYILEVEHSPKTHLSTLLLWPRDGKYLKEDIRASLLEQLFAGLLRNNGHWEKTDIKNNSEVRIVTVKHWDTWEPADWAEIIANKIG